MYKIFSCILFLVILLPFGESQILSNITLSKDSLYIGEEVELDITISFPSVKTITSVDYSDFDSIQSQIKISDIPDSMLRETYAEIEWAPDADFENRVFDISEFLLEGQKLNKKIAIRFWDVGVFKLPELTIIQDTSAFNFTVRHLQTPTIMVMPPRNNIGEIITPLDTTQALFPIAPILEEGKTWEDFIWLGYLLATILTMLLVAYMVYRSKRKAEQIEEEVIEVIRPAHEISLEKLDGLKSKELWQQGKIKAYQTELTYIIREYLENRFDIHALESTTDEIARDLKKRDFDTNQEENLKQILQIADLVKFAKAQPPADLHDKFYTQAVDFVEATKKLIQELGEVDDVV